MRLRPSTLVALCLLAVCSSDAIAQGAADPVRPATYERFRDVTAFKSFAQAIASASELYVPPGRHVVENPIVIDRDTPLFIHGADRMASLLVGKHPGKPLFVIRRAPLVGFASLRLFANVDANAVDQVAVRTENEAPVQLEIMDGVVEDSRLDLLGPGEVRIQAVSFVPHGRVTTSVLVDHPDVSVTLVGGNISHSSLPPRVETDQASHVWQKRGRLRIFGTGMQATLGPSDVRIESASDAGPHALVGIRTEGANGGNRGTYPCRLLAVPTTVQPVDVVLEANSQVCGRDPLGRSDGAIVDYNGRGTLWLLGNNGLPGAGALVVGKTSASRIVAVGNLIQHTRALAPSDTLVLLAGANLGRASPFVARRPATRFLPPNRALPEGLEPPPRIDVPPALTRPRLTAALPGMLDARSFGAKGDGVRDDTRSLQRALDAACGEDPKLLFLPAGTYRTTRQLLFNHQRARCRKHGLGGWIAGAGSDRTIIVRDRLLPGGVFETQGLAYATIQGLTFRTHAYDPARKATGREPAFALENHRAVGHATQAVSFHDVVFDGGSSALAIGVESPEQCSENLLVDAKFTNAHVGLAVGGYNALANIVARGRFDDNDITVGHPEEGLSGGTWMVLGARVRGTRDLELNLRSAATATWYLNGLDSDTPSLVAVGGTGGAFPIVIEGATLRPRAAPANKRFILFGGGGGLVFLHSDVSKLAPSMLGGDMASSYLVGIDSALPDLSGVVVVRNAVATKSASAVPAGLRAD